VIQSYHRQYVEAEKRNKNPRWRWMVSYDFARMKKQDTDPIRTAFLDKMKQDIFTDTVNGKPIESDQPFIALLKTAARWAELETKNSNQ
jgi:hypothetical protein